MSSAYFLLTIVAIKTQIGGQVVIKLPHRQTKVTAKVADTITQLPAEDCDELLAKKLRQS